MLDRVVEERHLQLADAHIVLAVNLIARMERLAQGSRERGHDAQPATRSLSAMRAVLSAFHAHRNYIVQAISDIDAGKL
ncbi:hypothetical protein [Variovorax sp. OV329]|uniref:hypothetical protein n=1 Tax=Variovorax sp. OV329 TaxID=1882825 RepID=UPI001114280D|nr:hypothetical protein [Variovorax sp. OV329]